MGYAGKYSEANGEERTRSIHVNGDIFVQRRLTQLINSAFFVAIARVLRISTIIAVIVVQHFLIWCHFSVGLETSENASTRSNIPTRVSCSNSASQSERHSYYDGPHERMKKDTH